MPLREKGLQPNVLAMTATPIPRTLSITAYGDVLNSFERMGDYAMRITETVLRMKAPDKGDLNALSGLPSGPKAQPLG